MKFGSPGAHDATATREKWIEEAAKERVARLRSMDKILNRPIGSLVNASREEKLRDWEYRLGNPQETAQQIEQRASGVGMERAVLEFLVWNDEMEKLNGSST